MERFDSNFVIALIAAAMLGAIFALAPVLIAPVVLLLFAATCTRRRAGQARPNPNIAPAAATAEMKTRVKER